MKRNNRPKDSVRNMVIARQYVVGSISVDGALSFSSCPMPHNDEDSAMDEARRLALKEPGKAYVVAKFIGGSTISIGSL